MTSPVIPAPAVVFPTPYTRTATADLPAARRAEHGGAALVIDLAGCGPAHDGGPTDGCADGGHGRMVLHVAGEIDLLTVAQLRAALDQALTGARSAVVVDLRGVSFVDCAGIGVLVEARWRARCRDVAWHILPGQVVARTAALLDLTATLGLDERP